MLSIGMLSATASLGLIHLWDVENGLTAVDKYLYSNEDNIKAGALLAIGMLNSGVRGEGDYAYALLKEYVEEGNLTCRIAAIFG
jgi:26S proteasome regulatory subunit N1